MSTRPALGPLTRLRLAGQRRAVAAYAVAGWPVVAGAWWDQDGDRYRCGPLCGVAGEHAVCDGAIPGPDAAGPGSGRVMAPTGRHTLLLVTGPAVDVVELPATARAVAAAAARSGVPTAQLPTGRPLLFTRSGPLDPGLWSPQAPRPGGLIVHGEESLVALPPSRLKYGPVTWSGRFRRPLPVGELRPVAEVLDLVLTRLAVRSAEQRGGLAPAHNRGVDDGEAR